MTLVTQENEGTERPLGERAASRFTIFVIGLLTLLQMLLFALTGAPIVRATGIALGCAALGFLLLTRLSLRIRFAGAWILTAAIVVNLGLHLAATPAPHPYRVLQLAVALGYAGVLLAALLTLILRVRNENALLLSLSVATSLLGAELVLPRFRAVEQATAIAEVRWVGNVTTHPIFGDYYLPYTVLKSVYPDNPRHYFEEPDPSVSRWQLTTFEEGNEATLTLPTKRSGPIRVNVRRGETSTFWHIQLSGIGVSLKKASYELSFRAKADANRKIGFGISQDHAPWETLGLDQEVDLITDWKEYKATFSATAQDAKGKLHFDVGANGASVELADIVLRRPSDGVIVEPNTPQEYSVTYATNAFGCRGRDYSVPRPANHQRILAIGDSFTMGVGVHLADTFEVKLEQSLNAKRNGATGKTYEVVNCGISGSDTKDERLFYENMTSRYQPQVVLLVMVRNDDRPYREDVKLGHVKPPSFAEKDLVAARLLRNANQQYVRPEPDFGPNVREILKLQEACRQRGAKLAVVFFRHEELRGDWDKLIRTVTHGLAGKGMPLLDVGDELLLFHDPSELLVHKYDLHPNEIAHASAADQLERFLIREKLIE